MLPSGSALVGGPRLGGVLQPVQAGAAQQVPDCEARVTALCKSTANTFDAEGAHVRPLRWNDCG